MKEIYNTSELFSCLFLLCIKQVQLAMVSDLPKADNEASDDPWLHVPNYTSRLSVIKVWNRGTS